MGRTVTLGLTEARTKLSQIIKSVHTGKDTIILEKDGLAVAALINIDDLRKLKGDDIFDESLTSFSDEWNHPSNNVYDKL